MWLCVTSHSQNRKKKTKNRQFSIKRTENKITLVFFSFFILDSIKWYTKIQLHLNSVNKNRPNVHHITNSASQWLTPWGQWINAWIHSQYSLSTDGICQSIHQCNKPFVSKCPGGVKPSGRAVFICLLQHSCGFVCPVKRTEFCATMTVNANNRIHRTGDITSIQDIWKKKQYLDDRAAWKAVASDFEQNLHEKASHLFTLYYIVMTWLMAEIAT